MSSLPAVTAEAAVQRKPIHSLTLISIATCAASLVGLSRQIFGQAIATRLIAAGWLTTAPRVAQLESPIRLANACGTLFTLFLGGFAALLVRADKRLSGAWYFFWVFGGLCLMNSGRLLYSAISGTGDWAAVLTTLEGAWVLRIGLAMIGVFIYRPGVQFAATHMRVLVECREVAFRELWPLTLCAYVIGSTILTVGAVFDPSKVPNSSPALVAASFALNLGFVVVPAFISEPVEPRPRTNRGRIDFSWQWLLAAVICAAAFIGGLGRAIHL
jgi:hypothetical protein